MADFLRVTNEQEIVSNLVFGDLLTSVSPRFNSTLGGAINFLVLYERAASAFGQPIIRIEIDPTTYLATVSAEDEGWHNAAVGSAPAGETRWSAVDGLNDKMYMAATSSGAATGSANPYICAYDLQNGTGPVEQEGNDVVRKHLQISAHGNISNRDSIAMCSFSNTDVLTFHNTSEIAPTEESRLNLMTVAGSTTFTIVDPDNPVADEPLDDQDIYHLIPVDGNRAAMIRLDLASPVQIGIRQITRAGAVITGESTELTTAVTGSITGFDKAVAGIGNDRVLVLGADTLYMYDLPGGGGEPTLVTSLQLPIDANGPSFNDFDVDLTAKTGLVIEKRNRISEPRDRNFYGVRFTFDEINGTLISDPLKTLIGGDFPAANVFVHHLDTDVYALFWQETGSGAEIIHYWTVGLDFAITKFYFGTNNLVNERIVK